MKKNYDLICIGGGSAGFNAARLAASGHATLADAVGSAVAAQRPPGATASRG